MTSDEQHAGPDAEPEPVVAAPIPRRSLIGGLALGGAALGAGALGAVAVDKVAGASGYRREQFTIEVACLASTMRTATQANQADDADGRAPFLVEGWIYPEGTIPGDGFVPTDVDSIGRWFCRGWFIIDGDRGQPHTVSHQDFVFGTITLERLFPPDTMAAVGLEGTDFRDQSSARSVIGGTGKYIGATGQVMETFFALNTSTFSGDDEAFGPCFRFDFDIRVLD
jgi:hypothetical protein